MKSVSVVTLIVLLTGISFAQSDIGLKAVGGRIGFIMPEDPIDDTIGFGLNTDLGTLMPNLTLHGYLDYWSKSYESDLGFGTNWESSFSILGIIALVKYHFEMEGNIKPYAGGGLGLMIGTGKSEYTNPITGAKEEDSSSDSELGIQLVGGAAMPLSPELDGFAELKYNIDGADYFGIYVGVSYKLK